MSGSILCDDTHARDRGLFAQEVIQVTTRGVTPGTDERNDAGHLVQPWSLDYSKYVPDLIVGWQQHDAQLAMLTERLDALTRGDAHA